MIGTRTLLLASTLALAGCSLAPQTVLPTPPVPQSWPVGDAYLLQSEAALPILQSWRLNPGATQLMPSRRRERPEP